MNATSERGRPRMTAILIATLLATLSPATARAFCGFYVAAGEDALYNEATQVVLTRAGELTYLSMRNQYRGPAEDFAMVVPVPVVLSEDDVVTLHDSVFSRLLAFTAPRLVEYWETDPCEVERLRARAAGRYSIMGAAVAGDMARLQPFRPLVRVEAQFASGEYDIVILGADDSMALESWLREHGYRIPDGASRLLRPYVEQGMHFFVAKVDASRVAFEDGRAMLSPLRIRYRSPEFSLPIRLGMINSAGTQDLLVHILGERRYQLANRPNVTIPTNLDVTDEVRDHFGEFYRALFDRTVAANPGAAVTEYVWDAGSCDPCTTEPPSAADLAALGHGEAQRESAREEIRAFIRDHGVEGESVRFRAQSDLDQLGEAGRRAMMEAMRACQRIALETAEGETQQQIRGTISLSSRNLEGFDPVVWTTSASVESESLRACATEAFTRVLGEHFDASRSYSSGISLDVSFGISSWPSVEARRLLDPSATVRPPVVTRVHLRYDANDPGEDLVFRRGGGLVGGREEISRYDSLEEVQGAQGASYNAFQARYAIRHPWGGALDCDRPIRGVWESRASAGDAVGSPPAQSPLGDGSIALERTLVQPVPALALEPIGEPTASPYDATEGSDGESPEEWAADDPYEQARVRRDARRRWMKTYFPWLPGTAAFVLFIALWRGREKRKPEAGA